MNDIKTIGIVGLGALGTMYAELFTRALGKEHVLVLADRERTARYRRDGMWYNGERCDLNYTDAATVTEPVDLLLFTVKFTGLPDAIETCRHLVGPETTLVSILNGISSEELLCEAFGDEGVVWCVVGKVAAQKEGNRVTMFPVVPRPEKWIWASPPVTPGHIWTGSPPFLTPSAFTTACRRTFW